MPDFSAASRESPTLPKYPAKPSMKYAILVRGTWNIGQSYHLSLSLLPSTPYRSYPPSCHFFVVIPLLPSTPYTFYPLACHFFVVIPLLPSAPYRSYPPACHFCGYPSHIVHDSPLPEPTNAPKSCAVPSVTHTDLGSTSKLPISPQITSNDMFAQRTPTHFRQPCA